MEVGTGNYTYEWIEDWVKIPDTQGARDNGRTHGVAVLRDGRIVIFHQAVPAVLVYSPEGELLSSFGEFPGAHGMALVEENGEELLWLTDEKTAKVAKVNLEGQVLQELQRPDIPAYQNGGKYIPTWVAVNETRHGGNGDVWVADGYGSSLVHRYDSAGNYVTTITGEEGAGAFACPHAVAFDPRKDSRELYITDRGNNRLQVYDANGNFLRVFGEGEEHFPHPCCFDWHGELMLIPDLFGHINLCDANDRLITSLGDHRGVIDQDGWPNNRDNFIPGQFNSPHGGTFDAEGNIFIVEWITGGRIIKLLKK